MVISCYGKFFLAWFSLFFPVQFKFSLAYILYKLTIILHYRVYFCLYFFLTSTFNSSVLSFIFSFCACFFFIFLISTILLLYVCLSLPIFFSFLHFSYLLLILVLFYFFQQVISFLPSQSHGFTAGCWKIRHKTNTFVTWLLSPFLSVWRIPPLPFTRDFLFTHARMRMCISCL